MSSCVYSPLHFHHSSLHSQQFRVCAHSCHGLLCTPVTTNISWPSRDITYHHNYCASDWLPEETISQVVPSIKTLIRQSDTEGGCGSCVACGCYHRHSANNNTFPNTNLEELANFQSPHQIFEHGTEQVSRFVAVVHPIITLSLEKIWSSRLLREVFQYTEWDPFRDKLDVRQASSQSN